MSYEVEFKTLPVGYRVANAAISSFIGLYLFLVLVFLSSLL